MKAILDHVRDLPFLLLGVVFSTCASIWIFKNCVRLEITSYSSVNELLPYVSTRAQHVIRTHTQYTQASCVGYDWVLEYCVDVYGVRCVVTQGSG